MNDNDYNLFREYMKLVAQYDWAVEGGTAPVSDDPFAPTLTREQAKIMRESLLKACRTVVTA